MKVTLKATQPLDLFRIVTLQPGDNEIDAETWAAVSVLRLGDSSGTFVDHLREQGTLVVETPAPKATAEPAKPEQLPEEAAQAAPAPTMRKRKLPS